MADYSPATIRFLATALNYVAVQSQIKDIEEDSSNFVEKTNRGITEISDTDARWGHFDKLESILRNRNVPYEVYSEGIDGHAPTIRHYRPKLSIDEFYTYMSYEDGARLLTVDEVREMLQKAESLEEVTKWLDSTYPEIEPLESYVVSYPGNVKPRYARRIDSDTELFIEIYSGDYADLQFKTAIGSSSIHRCKLVLVPIHPGHTRFTFFFDDEQYWLDEFHHIDEYRGGY